MHSILTVLKRIRPESDFTASDDFIRDGMLDSFDVVMLVSELDKTFAISIAGTDIIPDHFKDLKAIETLLNKYGAKP